jgi:hypothetical protein
MIDRFKHRILCLAAWLLCPLPSAGHANSGSIGIYLNAEGTSCSAAVEAYVPFTLYVIADLAGPTTAGISAAEFQIVGLPSEWFILVTSNPLASFVGGNPAHGNSVIMFPDCQTGSAGRVNLFTIYVGPYWTPDNLRLRVAAWGCPYTCLAPVLRACDAPAYTGYWVPGGEAVLNGPPCTVDHEPIAWSEVKQLYR